LGKQKSQTVQGTTSGGIHRRPYSKGDPEEESTRHKGGKSVTEGQRSKTQEGEKVENYLGFHEKGSKEQMPKKKAMPGNKPGRIRSPFHNKRGIRPLAEKRFANLSKISVSLLRRKKKHLLHEMGDKV